MANSIISINNVSKYFKIPHESRNTLKSYFLSPFRRVEVDEFHALNNVNLQINQGEIVGIIGKNGCGKSTLLKLIAGIYSPSKGDLKVEGSIVPFLELGIGFNPELTGRENIFLNGTILGMTRKYLEKHFNEIVEFAELHDFLDLQVKNYSSGMRVRLAFAIAVQAKADIYLLDEVLAVGDVEFQKKSFNKMQELLKAGSTVLFVSHSLADVKRICTRAVFIEQGNVSYDGDVDEATRLYQMSLLSKEEQEKLQAAFKMDKNLLPEIFSDKYANTQEAIHQKTNLGDGRVELLEFNLLNSKGEEKRELYLNEKFTIDLSFKIHADIVNPLVAVRFGKGYSESAITFHTPADETRVRQVHKGDVVKVKFQGTNLFLPGDYYVQVQFTDPVIDGVGKGDYIFLIKEYMTIKSYIRDQDQKKIVHKLGVIHHDFIDSLEVIK